MSRKKLKIQIMERNIEKSPDKHVETQKSKDSGSKSPKTDQIKKDTSKRLNENLKK
jgi:hypothetical protein